MICEQTRIKEAQDNLYKWCQNHLPLGRRVTQEDREGISRVHESNLISRKTLFGSEEYVWYLKFEVCAYDYR